MSKRCLALLVLIIASLPMASGQTPDTATILGTVFDASHALVVGAKVRVVNRMTGLDRSVVSDGRGGFVIAGLPVAGTYAVTAAKVGFATAQSDVKLAGGSTAIVVLDMSVAAGKTEVTVTGAAGDVRIDEPQLGNVLDAEKIGATPLMNERITYLPLLNAANRPAINQGDIFMDQSLFTTNGAGRRQAWFEVDGETGNDSWGRQTIFTNIPVSAVHEMTVLTNSFSTEYGASTGSVVNIVTKSGGAQYHGEVDALWRPTGPEAALSGFTATTAAIGNDVTNDRLVQQSFAIGGPLGFSPKTRFFVAAEHSDEDKASPITSVLAPGSYTGVYHDWMGFVRLDHQFSEKNNAFFRGNSDAYFDTNPNGIVGGNSLASVARIFRRRTYSGELGDTAVLSAKVVNHARVQFQLASPITEFDPVVYGTQYVVPIAGLTTFTSGTSQSAVLMNRQYQVSDMVSVMAGRHQLKFGGSAIVAHTGGNGKEFGGPVYLGKFTYNTCSLAASVCEGPTYLNDISKVANYQQSFGNASYTVTDTIWSLFVQDDFRVSKQVTLNAGLRYERQTFTDATTNFGPRMGFVYDVGGRGRTAVRGGFGIYYSQVVDNAQANYSLTGPTGVFTFTATPGQVGFPTSVAAAPIASFPTGGIVPLRTLYLRPGNAKYYDQFFPTSSLVGYPDKLLNPYSEQYTLSVEQRVGMGWIGSVDYVGTYQLRNIRPLDVDAPTPFIRTAQNQTRTANAANCTRPYWVYFYAHNGGTCSTSGAGTLPPYSVIQSDVNDGILHYNALDVNVRHDFSHRFEALLSYTWSHTQDNVDPDTTGQNPNDANFTGLQEYGNAIYDQRHRLVVSGMVMAPLKIRMGGVATMASGLPYNLVTGTNNSGDTGATTDRPVINGVVVGRNTGRGTPIYDVDPFIARAFPLFKERVKLDLRVEAFNALNHANFVAFNGTYGNAAAAPATLGAPNPGVAAQLPARSLQFGAKVTF